MKKDNSIYLKEIIEFIDDIEKYVDRSDYDHFINDEMLQDAIIRKIELIGEAARRLKPVFWEDYKNELPLALAVAIRNRLIHEYDDIDLEVVWDTVKKDLPELKRKIEEILEKEGC